MKRKLKRKHNSHRTLSAPGPKPRKAQREAVVAMAQAGLVEDQIASRLGVDKNKLRAQHIDDIKEGKAAAAAADAEAVITKEEYYFLDAASSSFSAPGWFDPEYGSLLFPGTNGEGARNLADAFAGWKAQGGRFITAGLSGKFNPKKYAAFAEVVSDYRQKLKLQGDDAPPPRKMRSRNAVFEE
jgi:hypothetical protein